MDRRVPRTASGRGSEHVGVLRLRRHEKRSAHVGARTEKGKGHGSHAKIIQANLQQRLGRTPPRLRARKPGLVREGVARAVHSGGDTRATPVACEEGGTKCGGGGGGMGVEEAEEDEHKGVEEGHHGVVAVSRRQQLSGRYSVWSEQRSGARRLPPSGISELGSGFWPFLMRRDSVETAKFLF